MIEKTGIFGGAFDPVHNGHVHLAKEAISQLKLRRLLIIPTYESPHKNTKLLPFEQRAEMCRLAFTGIGEGYTHGSCKIEISDIEQKMGGVSYTINTLRELKKLYRNGINMSRYLKNRQYAPRRGAATISRICSNLQTRLEE